MTGILRKIVSGFIKRYTTSLKIIGVYSATLIVVSLVFYKLIPIILNYPDGTVGGKFQMELENTDYTTQYFLITLLIFFGIAIYFFIKLKDVNNWNELLDRNDAESLRKLEHIRQECISLPYTFYLIQIIIPSIMIVVIHTITTRMISITTTFKIWILFFSFITLAAVFSHMFCKRIFSRILLETYRGSGKEGVRVTLVKNIFLQLIPMFIVALLFTSLTGYSRLVSDKGNSIFKLYNARLLEQFDKSDIVENFEDVSSNLKKVNLESDKDIPFIISPENSVFLDAVDVDGSKIILSAFFKKYLDELAFQDGHNGHVYEYYGIDVQGSAIRLKGKDGYWLVGIKYEVASLGTLTFFAISFIALLIINIIVLTYFSRTLTENVTRVANSLSDIALGGDVNLEKSLPVTSNDEIGDLVVAFNKIQQREKENIESLKEQQAILLEQERLASLGQLIGGIAHNLKTPIMSISGGIEALKDLAVEYRDSVDDQSVTNQDHKEIAKEMLSWLEKMKPYCSYMSDVISAVKGQTVQLNASTTSKFTVDELVKRVDLLMKHELKKYHCMLNIESNIDMSTEIKGEVNNLVQVFDNIIINALQAYEGQQGVIDFKIVRSGDNVEFTFKDYGKGIPQQVSDKLFKEMVTTKGKNGTGLGLYMSYSTIKGRFGGNMSFISKEKNGTTFYISIPCITYDNRGVDK